MSKDGKRVGRPKNTDIRVREHLTPGEVEALEGLTKKTPALLTRLSIEPKLLIAVCAMLAAVAA